MLLKKIALSMILFAICIIPIAAVPSDDVIRASAADLGVPYEDLKAFVSLYDTGDASPEAIEVELDDYVRICTTNQYQADKLYSDKLLRFDVVFDSIESSYLSWDCNYAIIDEDFPLLSLNVLPSEEYKLEMLTPGMHLVMEGYGTGDDWYIDNCRILSISR